VNDGLHAAQRMAEGRGIGEIAERDLHPHALGAEPPRIAHQAPDGGPGSGELTEHGPPDGSGGPREQ
jgi:hypothetical protein